METYANDYDISLDDNDKIIAKSLFFKFLSEEFEKIGLNHKDILTEDVQAQGDNNQTAQAIKFSKMGTTLREEADEFDRSPQRQSVRDEADKVELETITQDHFWCLLDEVFKNGVTSTRVIALFYFCSDVLIRSVKQRLKNLGIKLLKWAIGFIFEKVCKWVHDRGGWENISRDGINIPAIAYIAFGALIGGIIGFGIYQVWKK